MVAQAKATGEQVRRMIRTHLGVSLDGFAATPGGLPAWEAVPGFQPGAYGTAEHLARSEAIVIGRTSFDQGFEYWLEDWPYGDKQVYVLTSRPLPNCAPATVIASAGGPAGLVRQLVETGLTGDVLVLGGPRTIQALMTLGALDRLGLVVLPVLLGRGIPLFAIETTTYSTEAWNVAESSPAQNAFRNLRLDSHGTFPDGAVELVYAPA